MGEGSGSSFSWQSFFKAAGLPSSVSANYAVLFTDNRIKKSMLPDLSKEVLNELGVKCVGDVIAILRFAQEFHYREMESKFAHKEVASDGKAEKTAAAAATAPEAKPKKADTDKSSETTSKPTKTAKTLQKERKVVPQPKEMSEESTVRPVKKVSAKSRKRADDGESEMETENLSARFSRKAFHLSKDSSDDEEQRAVAPKKSRMVTLHEVPINEKMTSHLGLRTRNRSTSSAASNSPKVLPPSLSMNDDSLSCPSPSVVHAIESEDENVRKVSTLAERMRINQEPASNQVVQLTLPGTQTVRMRSISASKLGQYFPEELVLDELDNIKADDVIPRRHVMKTAHNGRQGTAVGITSPLAAPSQSKSGSLNADKKSKDVMSRLGSSLDVESCAVVPRTVKTTGHPKPRMLADGVSKSESVHRRLGGDKIEYSSTSTPTCQPLRAFGGMRADKVGGGSSKDLRNVILRTRSTSESRQVVSNSASSPVTPRSQLASSLRGIRLGATPVSSRSDKGRIVKLETQKMAADREVVKSRSVSDRLSLKAPTVGKKPVNPLVRGFNQKRDSSGLYSRVLTDVLTSRHVMHS